MAELPTVLNGAYRLLRQAGAGGTARVYLAEDTATGQKVAIKRLRSELAAQPEFASRFEREAALLGHLRHPNLVQLVRFAKGPEGLLLILEWVEGLRLDEYLKQTAPVDAARAMKVLTQVAAALAAIHDQGIVHRDLKPENLMVEQTADGPRTRLLDLGIARFADAAKAAKSFVTLTGKIAGTPTYLAPEQLLGKPPSTQTDVYAFGVLAYFIVAGKPPFQNVNDFVVMQGHLKEKPPVFVPVDRAFVGSPVLPLIAACLEKSQDKRPKDGRALLAALTFKK